MTEMTTPEPYESRRRTRDQVPRVTTDDEVRRRAYELYEARGGVDGDDVADWLAAEQELADRQAVEPDDLGEPPHDEDR
jgi:hypothetical protein